MLINLMDVYHCPTTGGARTWSQHHNSYFKYRIPGVFPIDGDCERFLMCRSNEKTEKIKGKVYRCPKGDYLPARRGEDHMLRFLSKIAGYLFSGFGARCQPEASVACHRNNPLSRLLERRLTHNRAKFFLMP